MKINYYYHVDDKELVRRRAMFNAMSNKCKCGKQASFNYPNCKRPTCCKKCMSPGMVNVKNKS